MRSHSIKNSPTCSPSKQKLWVIAFLVLTSLGLPFLAWNDPRHGDATYHLILATWIVVCAGCWLVALVWIFSHRVVAEAHSLRWRTFRGWRQAPWEAITDYYIKAPPQPKGGNPIHFIETTAGRVKMNALWEVSEEFKDAVRDRATQSRAREWDEQGLRPEDTWPRVFDYHNPALWQAKVGLAVIFTLITTYFGAVLVPFAIRSIAELGWGLGLAPALTMAVVLGCVCLMTTPTIFYLRDAHERRGERIIVSPQGITFEDGKRRVHSPWSGVRMVSWGLLPGWIKITCRRIIVTEDGTFDYTSALLDARQLSVLVDRFAPAAAEAGHREYSDAEDALDGRPYSVGNTRIYHYRIRTNRALLLGWTALAFVPIFAYWESTQGISTADPLFTSVLASLWIGSALYGWWRYWCGRVVVDETGIRQALLIGWRCIRWDEVRECQFDASKSMFAHVSSSATRIRFWMFISGVDELKAMVEQRGKMSGH